MKALKLNQGFTIVELVTVIAVIGILAAITVVSYRGIQNRAEDNARKSDITQMSKAVAIYSMRTGDQLIRNPTDCGTAGGGGYWSGEYGGESLHECVTAEMGNLPKKDPAGHAYMKANCVKDGEIVSYILTKLVSEPQNPNYIESICDSNYGYWTSTMGWDTSYGMNYGVKVPFVYS